MWPLDRAALTDLGTFAVIDLPGRIASGIDDGDLDVIFFSGKPFVVAKRQLAVHARLKRETVCLMKVRVLPQDMTRNSAHTETSATAADFTMTLP